MTLVEKINDGIKEAIKSRDTLRLAVLRMLKSKILAVDPRCSLADVEVVKLFKTYFGSLQEACEQAKMVNRPESAEELRKEMEIVSEFLPKALSMEETRQLVVQAIAQTGAKSKKDLGLVMKGVMQMNQAIDGKVAKEIASELLP